MTAYYNEHDPFAAQWLRELIKAGLIAPGIVDERSIEDVAPHELTGFIQCHFFAGIGVWSYALRRAGWSDDRPVWTGSCPCQPFSAAGKGDGFDDERHLWPAFYHLISQCRPPKVFGEQVASKAVDDWIDLVHADMEAVGYAFGSVPFPSAGIGAPHIRDRNYWMADSNEQQRDERGNAGPAGRGEFADNRAIGLLEHPARDGWEQRRPEPSGRGASCGCGAGGMADPHGGNASAEREQCGGEQRHQPEDCGTCGMADAEHHGCGGSKSDQTEPGRNRENFGLPDRGCFISQGQPAAGPTNGHWRDADWLFCRDGKWRPVEPGTFPLAHGATARVGRLRGYGNAINAEAAIAFIEASMK